MNGNRRSRRTVARLVLADPTTWTGSIVLVTTLMAFTAFHPMEKLLGQRNASSLRSSITWEDAFAWLVIAILLKTTWLRLFRRDHVLAERQQIRDDLVTGRLKRMPFPVRIVGAGVALLATLSGLRLRQLGNPLVSQLLPIAAVVLLLFVVQEITILVTPGDALLADRNDELLGSFSARALRTGFLVAVAILAGLSVLALVAPSSLLFALPVCLTLSVFVPALRLRRLEREADVEI